MCQPTCVVRVRVHARRCTRNPSTIPYARCCSHNLNVVTPSRPFSTSFHPSSFSSSLLAFVSLSLSLSTYLLFETCFHLCFALLALLLTAFPPPIRGLVKITLFLYNAHIRRSYCNLVRSRFRVIGREKSISTVAEHRQQKRKRKNERERERERESFDLAEIFCGRKSRAAINSPLKRNRSGTF